MNEHFTVRCKNCGRDVVINGVQIFRRNVQPDDMNLFSFSYDCTCGAGANIDGMSGDRIPENLKTDARRRYDADQEGLSYREAMRRQRTTNSRLPRGPLGT